MDLPALLKHQVRALLPRPFLSVLLLALPPKPPPYNFIIPLPKVRGLYLIQSDVYCTGRPRPPPDPTFPAWLPSIKVGMTQTCIPRGKPTQEEGQNLYFFLQAKSSAIAIFLCSSFSWIILCLQGPMQ